MCRHVVMARSFPIDLCDTWRVNVIEVAVIRRSIEYTRASVTRQTTRRRIDDARLNRSPCNSGQSSAVEGERATAAGMQLISKITPLEKPAWQFMRT